MSIVYNKQNGIFIKKIYLFPVTPAYNRTSYDCVTDWEDSLWVSFRVPNGITFLLDAGDPDVSVKLPESSSTVLSTFEAAID